MMDSGNSDLANRIVTAVGSGGSLTPDFVREFDARCDPSFLHGLAGVVAAAVPAFVSPLAGGAVLAYRETADHRAAPFWVHERALHPEVQDGTSASVAPWRDQLLRIKNQLQLTVGDLARFARVERPTVYHWLAGSQPRPGKQRRIDALEQFARFWPSDRLGSLRAHLTRPAGQPERNLEGLLLREQLDLAALRALADALARDVAPAAASRPRRAERLAARGFKPISEENYRRQRAGFVRSTSSGEE